MQHLTGRRTWTLLGIALAVAAVAFLAMRGLPGRRGNDPGVTTEAAARRDITVNIEATGVVEPVDLVEVKSKASGQILRMPVEVGSVVHAGDLLAQIDMVDVQNSYEQADAAERAAQAKVDVSQAQLRRAKELFAQQVITVAEHENAVLDYANAESQLVKARTDLDTARQRRDDATVRAPISGTILEQLVSAGQVIASATSSVSGGTALMRMADLGRIRLRALVSETDIGSVRPGQVATVEMEAFPDRTFRGEVEKVEPQAVVQQSVTMFPVLISIANEDGLLLPGMNGEVSMEVASRMDVVAIPLDAVRPVRELPSVAATFGLSADSVQAQLARSALTRRARLPGSPAKVDSSRGYGARAGRGQGPPGENRFPRDSGPQGPPEGAFGVGPASDGSGDRHRPEGPPEGGPGLGGSPGSDSSPDGSLTNAAGAGASPASADRGGRAQGVLVRTARGVEARAVRLGLSDYDYAQVLSGVREGDQVVLLGVAEQQTRRSDEQSRIRERMGNGMPGAPPGTGSTSRTSRGGR